MDQMSGAGPENELAVHALAGNIDVPFTPAAQRVIDRCVDSLADGDDAFLADCLLRAIAETPESAAAQLIEEHGQSGEELLAALEVALDRGAMEANAQRPPRLERILIRAKREAFRNRHPEVSTLHLLMALVRERTPLGFRS